MLLKILLIFSVAKQSRIYSKKILFFNIEKIALFNSDIQKGKLSYTKILVFSLRNSLIAGLPDTFSLKKYFSYTFHGPYLIMIDVLKYN